MSGVLDGANEAVRRLHEGIGRLDSASGRAMASLAGVGGALFSAGRGFLEGAFKMAESGAPFEQAMHDVERYSKATEAGMVEMNEAVFSSKNALMGFNAADSALALKELSRETGSVKGALDQLEPALLLAGIAGKSAEGGAKGLGVLLRSFHVEGKDAGEAVDRLAVGAKQFHVTAAEMEGSLGRVARGAQVVGASMTDAVITLGLMRSGLPTLGQAAAAANMAFMRMGDAKVSAALKKIGVDTKDAHGALLPLPAVLGQLAEKTEKMTDAERASALGKAFGARSAGAMTAAIKDLQKGVEDSTGHVHKGADAVKYLYEQMAHSEGAARRSRDAMLDTFAGQEKVIKASVESIKTGLAAPLAGALKPIVGAVADGLAKVVEFFASVDQPTKTFVAQAVLVAGVVVTVLGAAFMVLGGPATLAVLALAAAGGALFEAYRTNLGGFADWVHDTVGRATLAFRALASLLSKGGMSLDLFEELRADPSLMAFVLNVFVWVNKAKAWFGGLADGFSEGVARIKPALDALGVALSDLAARFGFVSGAVDPLANGTALTAAEANGKSLGEQLALVAEAAAKVATVVVELVDGAVQLAKFVGGAVDPVTALKVAFAAFVALKFASMVSGFASFTSSLASGNPAIAATTLAILALSAAYSTYSSLQEKYGKDKAGAAWWMNAKHNLGVTDDSEYWKQRNAMGGKGDPASIPGTYEYAHRSEAAYGGDDSSRALPAAPPPAATYGPPEPNSSTAVPLPAPPTGGDGSPFPAGEAAGGEQVGPTVAALQGAADAVRASSSRPMTLTSSTTIVLDSEVLATKMDEYRANQSDRGGVPLAPPG